MIPQDVRARFWACLGGIARENGMTALAVGGTDDHAHVLLALPATMSVAKAAQLLKDGSSKWLHETFPGMHEFAWQSGYGAFSIGKSGLEPTIAFIEPQEERHRTKTFVVEFAEFLKRHGIEHDPRYVFG